MQQQSKQDLSQEHHIENASSSARRTSITRTTTEHQDAQEQKKQQDKNGLVESESSSLRVQSPNASGTISTSSTLSSTLHTSKVEDTQTKLTLLNPISVTDSFAAKIEQPLQFMHSTQVPENAESSSNVLTPSLNENASTRSHSVRVHAALVDPAKLDEEHARLAMENTQLQRRIRDIARAELMVLEMDDHNNDAKSWKINGRVCTVLAVVLIGVALALVFSLSGSSLPISSPTFVLTSTPTSLPSVYPTQRPSEQLSAAPTIGPSAQLSLSPTHTRRTSILQTLVPTTSFDTADAWDAFLMNNTETPQAQAIRWLVEEDEYSSEPINMPTQELEERYALVVYYYATSGPEWRARVLFDFLDTKTSVCEWNIMVGIETFHELRAGVVCHYTGEVEKLIFSNCSMRGSFPSELALLRDLEDIILEDNEISGTFPPEFGDLSQLEYVYVDGNSLRGPLPPYMPASLKEFSFSGNSINGSLPSGWGLSSTRLLSFIGDRNHMVGSIPSQFGLMTNLAILNISLNDLTGSIPSEVCALTTLTSLSYDSSVAGCS